VPTVVVVTAFGVVACVSPADAGADAPAVYTVPKISLGRFKDVIGAADAFCGGLVAGRAAGRPFAHSLVWASCCGSISVTASGAQESMPTAARLAAIMEERGLGLLGGGTGVPEWPHGQSALLQAHAELEALVSGVGAGRCRPSPRCTPPRVQELPRNGTFTHTYTYAYIYAHIHTRTHAHTHTYSYSYTHKHIHTYIYTCNYMH